MNLPSSQFLELNKRRYFQSVAVKDSNRKKGLYLPNQKKKVRKQILLSTSENRKLEMLAKHFSISNSSILGYCVNELYDTVNNKLFGTDKNVSEQTNNPGLFDRLFSVRSDNPKNLLNDILDNVSKELKNYE